MKNVLQINSTILGEHSVSRSLSDYAANKLRQQHEATVTVRETEGLPHLTGQTLAALSNNSDALDSKGRALVDLSNTLIEELQAADAVILGTPTYNFFIPSQLKSYFDFVSRAGVTFKYTQSGPVGLLDDKKVYVINASGGVYQATGEDTVGPYIKTILKFIGLQDVHFVHAEGLALDQGANRNNILWQAKERLSKLLEVGEVPA